MAKLISAERKADILRRIPMGRLVEVDEVALMVAWLVESTGSVAADGRHGPARAATSPRC